MKLHGTLTSPYVRKARALIIEKNLEVTFVRVATPSDPQGDVRRLNPLAKVPVLELDDGSALYDSPVITEYLDSLSAPALIPPVGASRWQTLRIAALADGLVDAVVTRLLQQRQPEASRSQGMIAHEEWRIERAVAALADDAAHTESPQSANAVPLVGDGVTLADLAACVALGYLDFRFPESNWKENHPGLARWALAVGQRPSLRDTVPPAA